MLKPQSLIIFSLGVVFGILPWFFAAHKAEAQARPGASRGAGHAGVIIENYQFNAGRKKTSVRTQRDLIVVDPRYGSAFAVTSVKGRSVIWYRANDGTVHNVILENGLEPVRIIRQQ